MVLPFLLDKIEMKNMEYDQLSKNVCVFMIRIVSCMQHRTGLMRNMLSRTAGMLCGVLYNQSKKVFFIGGILNVA